MVVISHEIPDIPSVCINNYKGGNLATDYLIKMGHKKIGILTGPDISHNNNSKQRLKGYIDALKNKNIAINKKFIASGNFSYKSGYYSMEKLYSNSRNEVEAVFACDDLMALGVIRFLHDKNINVPNDISVIDFDNILHTKYYIPKLTTVAQPKIKMGKESVKIIKNLIDNNSFSNKSMIYEPQIIERNSCKCR